MVIYFTSSVRDGFVIHVFSCEELLMGNDEIDMEKKGK